MHLLRVLPVAAFAAALLAPAPPGPAYLIHRKGTGKEIAWDTTRAAPNVVAGRVTFYLDTAGVPDVSPSQFAGAVREAIGAWGAVDDAAIAFEEDAGRPASKKSSGDRVNRFGFSAGILSPFTYAAAFRTLKGARLVDADVVFNPEVRIPDGGAGTPVPWSTSTPGIPGRADVESVAAHEWGHGIGFDHVPLGRSTMYFALPAGAIMFRTLETDDGAGLGHLYPAASYAAARATLRGRVDVAGTGNDRGVQVTAVSFATGRPAASSVSEPDGTYAVEGLPPGVYRLLASPLGRARVRAGVYSPFWDDASTTFVPAVHATVGSTTVLVAGAGETLSGVDLSVATVSDPREPDDTLAQAKPLEAGASAGSRIEGAADRDLYSFQGSAGDRVSAWVHAWQIGSDLDPMLELLNPSGIVVASQRDIRGGTGSLDEEGFDLDARILDFTLPTGGTWYLRVSPENDFPPDAHPADSFYVVTLMPSTTDPHPATSELTVTPGTVDGDGASTAEALFRPRTLTGSDAGPGLAVTVGLDPDADGADGSVGPVFDHLDGTYSATVTAPAAGGGDTVRARVAGDSMATAGIVYRGPVDPDASAFSADPPRIRADGEAVATVVLVPRDAAGVPWGPGRAVDLSLQGSPDASLGSVADRGDGSYAADLSAGTEEETAVVAATVDGQPLGRTLPVGVGFPLGPVLDEVLAGTEAFLAGSPDAPAGALRKAEGARRRLETAAALSLPDDTKKALGLLRGAARLLERAARKAPGPGPLAGTLAEAARQAAAEALDAATLLADTPGEVRRLDGARRKFDRGEESLAEGRFGAAASKYRAAWRQAVRLL